MEKDKRHGVLAVNKRKIVASIAFAGVLSTVPNNIDMQGHEEFDYVPTPQELFSPITIYDIDAKNPPESNIPYNPLEIEVPITQKPLVKKEKTLTKKELKTQKLEEKRDYWHKLAKGSGRFSVNELKDMWIYLPYYIAAGEKFDVDWVVLYVNHQRESGGSAKNSKAFDGSTYPYVGGMQLNINYWPPEYQKLAVEKGENLRYLDNVFPTRHKGDIDSIFAAAKSIGANEDVNFKKTHSKSDSVRFGFVRFSGSLESGESRYQEYRKIKQIFRNQIDEIINK